VRRAPNGGGAEAISVAVTGNAISAMIDSEAGVADSER
jgi:hypothetical protein